MAQREAIYADPDDDNGIAWATVVAIDPGVTTGWAVMAVQPVALYDPEYAVLDNVEFAACGEVAAREEPEQVHELAELCAAWPDAAVVVEDFILGTAYQSRDLLSPVRLTAGLEYALWLQDRVAHRQKAADAKRTVTDARLKEWGFYERTTGYGGRDHARDALRHALLFLRRAKGEDRASRYLREVAWPERFGPAPSGGAVAL